MNLQELIEKRIKELKEQINIQKTSPEHGADYHWLKSELKKILTDAGITLNEEESEKSHMHKEIETNISFTTPYPTGILGLYDCHFNKIEIFLPEFSGYTIKDEDSLREIISFSINHEYLHALIHKSLGACTHTTTTRFNEEHVVVLMLGLYRSEYKYGELYYKDYTHYWKE